MPLRIFGIAAALQHHPPGLAPAFAMHADLADFDGHVAVVVDAPPATCSRLGPDAGRDIGHDAQLDDVVPSAPLALGVQRSDIEPVIGPEYDCAAPRVWQASDALDHRRRRRRTRCSCRQDATTTRS